MSTNHLEALSAAGPCVMVIFGATGDLTKRKLIPALLNLAQENVLSKQFAIVGFAGNDIDTETFRKNLGEEMPKFTSDPIDLKMWEWLSQRIYYVKGDFLDPEAYKTSSPIEYADQLKGNLLLSLESSTSRMSNLARQQMHFNYFFGMQEILDKVESITEDQVLAMSNQLFQPELVAVTLLGRLDGVKLTRNQLEC